MKIKVNGIEKIYKSKSLALNQLLKDANVESPETVTVQINGEFVRKEDFAKTHLKEGDEADFLYLMGGGGER